MRTCLVAIVLLGAPGIVLAETNAYVNCGNTTDAIDADTDTNLTPGGIAAGGGGTNLAITPDGLKVFVPSGGSHLVYIIDTETNTPGAPIDIGVGYLALFVGITPDGSKAYCVNYRNGPLTSRVTAIDTAGETILPGSPVTVGIEAQMVAFTPDSSEAWIPNFNSVAPSSTVSVVRTSDDTVIATIPVQRRPIWVAIRPQGDKAYVANNFTSSVSIIDVNTHMNTLMSPITMGMGIGFSPNHIAITPNGSEAYVANVNSNTVSVINTATDTVSHVLAVGMNPYFTAITPDGARAYVANNGSNDVSVIDIATHTVLPATISVGMNPEQLAVSPDGSKVYVANTGSSSVSVINNLTTPPVYLTDVATSDNPFWVEFTGTTRFISASGFQISNRFLSQTDLVNVILVSDPTNNPEIAAYEFYRNEALTDLAGSVSASPPVRFEDHRRKKGVSYTYYIVSVDIYGDRELQGSFTLNP